MPKLFHRLLAVALLGSFTAIALSETEASRLECVKSAGFLAPLDSPEHRKYAPEREVEVRHLALDVTPDFQRRTVEGRATWQFKPIIVPVREVKLDAVDLNVHSVTATEKIQGYQVTEKQVIVTFAEPIPTNRTASLTITYQAEPVHGLYFRTPEMGYKAGDTHLFTQGEQTEARYWYPCFDSPNQRFTSEMTCRVPEGMTVISNGRLLADEKDPATGLRAVRWSQEQPHANYLITLVAGYFKKLEAKHKDIPLAFYTLPSEFHAAATSFRDTADMMAFFEQEIGVPYPWPKYDQVCVNDFVAGGMENTSATTLTDGTLFTEATENLRESEGLVAHELAHQWFGDLVTCRDWSHIWLNEGFATYYEALYREHKHGRDFMLYELYDRARFLTGLTDDTRAIVRRTYDDPGEMFSHLAYQKGSWVLHMLRSALGEDLYRRCIKTYLERHRHGGVDTEDLRAVIEEFTGQSYDQFFDQWVYHAHYPELEVSYSWDEPSKLAKVSIRQVQKLDANVWLFKFPLTIRFKGAFGVADQRVEITAKEEEFYFPLASAPEVVRLDPDYTLLAKISFAVPNAMLYAQLADATDLPGRLLAIEQLATKRDQEAIAKLKQALNQDAFVGVRLEASKALRAIHSDEALAALLTATNQPDARVRQQVVSDVGGFYRESAYEFARLTAEREKNPDILATALRDLGRYAKPEVREALLKSLNSESFRNGLADAAIAAMRAQDDPAYLAPLLETLPRREADFTTHAFSQGLSTLAYLARKEEQKDQVREFLIGYVNHQKRTLRVSAISALGTLGDPKAIAAVETFANAPKESRERAAATRAVADLRAGRKPVDDFKNLRQEVLDLQKANRDLRKELDSLKKKVEAKDKTVEPKTPASAKSKKKGKTPKER